jgi:hypothetical protein
MSLTLAVVVGAAVAVTIGVYARVHEAPATRPLPTVAVTVRSGSMFRT